MRIVCTAKLAGTTAGHVDHAMAYAVGLVMLGHEVVLMDHVSRSRCVDAQGQPVPFEAWAGLQHFEAVARRYGLWPRACLFGWAGQTHGLPYAQARAFAKDAELLLVRSGKFHKLEEIFNAPARRVFLDGNPGQTQADFEAGHPEREALDAFELRCTLGLNIGTPASPVPCSGLAWHTLPRPVVMPMWPVDTRDNGRFSTVSSWKGRASFALGGTASGDKSDNWQAYLGLPHRTGQAMEIALRMTDADTADHDAFVSRGWRLSDPTRLDRFDDYRDFIGGSHAEFSVAHNRYVAFNTGWFSDRSATYLASGKPVVVQSTGIEAHLPTGEGLLTFRTPEEAVDCIAAVRADPARHRRAAREIAEEHFASHRVLQRLLALVT